MKKWIFEQSSGTPKIVYLMNFFIVIAILTLAIWLSFAKLGYNLNFSSIYPYKNNLVQGFFTTLLLSFIALFFSLVTGIIFGLMQRCKIIALKILAKIYIEIIRGTPLLVQILIFFYVVAFAAGIRNRFAVGIAIMAIFSGAYIAEIIRAGIESVAKSQLETATSLGLTKYQIYRYIIFPQVITRVLPPLTGQFASLIKDSSLLSVIAIKEFTMAAREVNASTFSTLESYIPLAIGYLIITLPISILTSKLEKKYSYDS